LYDIERRGAALLNQIQQMVLLVQPCIPSSRDEKLVMALGNPVATPSVGDSRELVP
jgi:hypothetical protein